MPFTSNDVAAFTKREHAQRTRLVCLVTLVLALALFILPTFESPITSITGDSRLLGPLDLCRRDRDDCLTDRSKTKPGLCGCGVPDIDSDGDGTPDCNDGCPRDASKASPGVCGCGIPDSDTDGDGMMDCKDGCPRDANKTSPGVCGCVLPDTDTDGDGTLDCYDRCPIEDSKTRPGVCGCVLPDTDTDGDGTLDCRDDCIDNDPSVLSVCAYHPGYNCEGCAGKYIRLSIECGWMCLSDIDYCLDYIDEVWYFYDDNRKVYWFHNQYIKIIQTGADSSNSVVEINSHDVHNQYADYYFLNGVPCSIIRNDTRACLVSNEGNEYCIEEGVPPLPSNPVFFGGDEANHLVDACLGSNTATTSEFEMKPISSKLSPYARAFFDHGA